MSFSTLAISLLGSRRDTRHVQLWYHRALCLVAAFLIPCLGDALRQMNAAAVDPFWMRWVLCSAFFAAFLASHASAWMRRHFTAVVHGLAYILTLWLVALAAWNVFGFEYALQLLFGVSMLAVVLGIGPRRLKPLAAYLSVALLLTALALLATPTAAVNKPFFMGLMASAAFIVLIAVHWNVQAERALRTSEQRYRTLMEAANEAIFVADAATGMLTDANWTAQNLVGRSLGEIRQMHQSELHPPEKRTAYEEIFRQHVLDGTANHEAVCVVHRDGHWIPVEINARVVSIEDERAIVGVFHDVTHRQRYEQQLVEAKERAEELLKLKTSLLDNVSHEFRTPLSGIIGFADILAEESTGSKKEFAEIVALSARRLHTTLDAVLDLAQLESGNMSLHPSMIDLRAEVCETARSFRRRAEEKGLFLRVEQGDSLVRAWADRSGLHRALSNLIGNAVKFTEAGGVTVSVRTADADAPHAAVCIADTGVGIGRAFRPHLFEEFRQESEGNARRFEGSGLGLAVTQRLVHLMDGSITVESEKGIGSAFTVHLPATAPAEATAEAPSRRVSAASTSLA